MASSAGERGMEITRDLQNEGGCVLLTVWPRRSKVAQAHEHDGFESGAAGRKNDGNHHTYHA